jgi:hypothetical protein
MGRAHGILTGISTVYMLATAVAAICKTEILVLKTVAVEQITAETMRSMFTAHERARKVLVKREGCDWQN